MSGTARGAAGWQELLTPRRLQKDTSTVAFAAMPVDSAKTDMRRSAVRVSHARMELVEQRSSSIPSRSAAPIAEQMSRVPVGGSVQFTHSPLLSKYVALGQAVQ